jgi:hypothetical protein
MNTQKRLSELTSKALKNKIEPTFKNLMFLSLASSGGTTTDENEVRAFLKENVFYFIDGIIFIDELENVAYFNDSSRKIEEDREYTYKVLKTKIKAVQGSKGFKKFVSDNSKVGDFWFRIINSLIIKINQN